jgi:hypothetical protein
VTGRANATRHPRRPPRGGEPTRDAILRVLAVIILVGIGGQFLLAVLAARASRAAS